MLTRRANPHYKILNYSQLPGNRDAKYLGHTLNSYKRYNQPMTKPLSVIQRDRLNTHHSGAYEDVEDFHEGAVSSGNIDDVHYGDEIEKRKKERLHNRKETLFKRIKSGVYSTQEDVPRWTPTREAVLWYESKYGDRYYRWRVYFKPETIQTSFSCASRPGEGGREDHSTQKKNLIRRHAPTEAPATVSEGQPAF